MDPYARRDPSPSRLPTGTYLRREVAHEGAEDDLCEERESWVRVSEGDDRTIIAGDDADTGGPDTILQEVADALISRHSKQDISLIVEKLQRRLDMMGDGLELLSKNKWYRGQLIRAMIKMVCAFEILPDDIYISGLECNSRFEPFTRGGIYDVFEAKWPAKARSDQSFAVKTRRIHTTDHGRDRKEILIEAALCRQLHHEHILGFVGLERELFAPLHVLVSPWMVNGDLCFYLRAHQLSAHSLNRLLREVASGLQYLHDQSIIHGMLHGTNVLITDSQHACLGGFLTAAVTMARSTGVDDLGDYFPNLRWQAPEVLQSDDRVISEHSDVYSFGCLCLEAYILKPPFWYIKLDPVVVVRVVDGHRMRRPTPDECPGPPLSDSLWELLYRCWDTNPHERPTVLMITQILDSLSGESPGVEAKEVELRR